MKGKRAFRAKWTSQSVQWSRNFSLREWGLWRTAKWKTDFFQSSDRAARPRQRASIRPKSHWITAPWVSPSPSMVVLGFWSADWLSACCLKQVMPASSDPLGLSPFYVFSLFNFLFTTIFSLHLCPSRCFCSTILSGGCKVADPFAGGMHTGSGVKGSKCSQHNCSSSQHYQC